MSCAADPLEQLLAGTLTDTEVESLRAHLAACGACQAELDRLSDHAGLRSWATACGTAGPGSWVDTPSEIPRAPESYPPADEAGLAFLAPPTVAGDLGMLGPYRVLGELGRGGMGVVLKAYDRELARPVAIKVLRGDQTDRGARARFVREAQAAAGLQHDHVVPVHAVACPDDGPPYLVMPFVPGPTLRDRIRTEKRLEPRAAATVARQVALGLVAAHRAGLIHRDIKPANIILDAEQDRARIVDFGLVRLKERAEGTTQAGTVAGTPEYMSPEQITSPGEVDERTDVYGLSVTLYEALTGTLPFRGTPEAVLRQVLDDEPTPPRRLSHQVPRDLETICLKAMAKEPARRYASARELADDLDRFLQGEPLRARPVGRAERLWRWARRKPALAALSAAVVVTLAGGLAGVTSQWRRARHEWVRAEASRGKAHQVVHDYFTQVSENKLLHKPGLQPLRKELLETALGYYQEFLHERGGDPTMLAEVAATSARVGRINDALGATDAALSAYREALALYDRLAREHPDEDHRAEQAQTYHHLAALQSRMTLLDAALGSLEQARTLQESLIQGGVGGPDIQADLARTCFTTGTVLLKKDRRTDAVAAFQRSLDLRRQLVRDHPERADYQGDLAATAIHLGNMHYNAGENAQALAAAEQARDILVALVQANPAAAEFQNDLSDSYSVIANVHNRARRLNESLRMWQQVQAIRERLAYENPTVVQYQWGLALAYAYVGKQHSECNQFDEALAAWQQAVPLCERLIRLNPGLPEYRLRLVDTHVSRAHVLSKRSRQPEALAAFEQARGVMEELVRDYPDTTAYRHMLGICCHNQGNELQQVGRLAEARSAFERCRDLNAELAAQDPKSVAYQDMLIRSYNKLGGVEARQNRLGPAQAHFEKAMELARKLQQAHPTSEEYLSLLATCYTNRGDVARARNERAEAEAAYLQAIALREKLVQEHPQVTDVYLLAAQATRDLGSLWQQDRPAEALEPFDRCRRYCEEALRVNERDLRARSVLGQAWDGRGAALTALGRRDEALAAYRQAEVSHRAVFAAAPEQTLHRERLSEHFEGLARLHRDARRPADAAAASLEQEKLWPTHGDKLAAVAADLARCIPLVGLGHPTLSAAEQTERDQHAAQALAVLRRAVANDYHDTARLRTDPALAPLRANTDFQKLLLSLAEKRTAGGPTTSGRG